MPDEEEPAEHRDRNASTQLWLRLEQAIEIGYERARARELGHEHAARSLDKEFGKEIGQFVASLTDHIKNIVDPLPPPGPAKKMRKR